MLSNVIQENRKDINVIFAITLIILDFKRQKCLLNGYDKFENHQFYSFLIEDKNLLRLSRQLTAL